MCCTLVVNKRNINNLRFSTALEKPKHRHSFVRRSGPVLCRYEVNKPTVLVFYVLQTACVSDPRYFANADRINRIRYPHTSPEVESNDLAPEEQCLCLHCGCGPCPSCQGPTGYKPGVPNVRNWNRVRTIPLYSFVARRLQVSKAYRDEDDFSRHPDSFS